MQPPDWTIYFCAEIHTMYIFFVIPSNCSAALLTGKNAVTSTYCWYFFLTPKCFSKYYNWVFCDQNCCAQGEKIKTKTKKTHTTKKPRRRHSQVCIASTLICVSVVGFHVIKATQLISADSPAATAWPRLTIWIEIVGLAVQCLWL